MSRVAEPKRRRRSDCAIAILGAACRLPGAADLDAFWSLLAEGRDAVTTVPADRFTQAAFIHQRPGEVGKSYTFAAGTLGDIAGFDHAAFGISPREAAEMDPQQRLLLEVTVEAIEDAGIPASRLAGSGTGVFVGASLTDYGDLRQADAAGGDRYLMTGSALSILANRIGNVFDLHGPAQTIDTACSSALVALHWACEALRGGRVPAALVGGVNLLLSPFPFIGFARAGMLSPAGRCHAFDARADGYVRAEGAGMVVLKRLDDALADGDAIRAIILGSGVNAAGRTLGLSLPSQSAQTALLEQVMTEAGVAADRIGYFEAHGTGTAAGDPIEAGALGTAIGMKRTDLLPIGSVKTNIGHTEPASGIAGLLKAMLVLEKGQIPASLHYATPNPAIDFGGLGLRVPTVLEPLRRRARVVTGVNSFGFGGTNACVLLAAAPARRASPVRLQADHGLPPLLLSARSTNGLKALARDWQACLGQAQAGAAQSALPALLRGAARHRDLLPHRLALRGTDPASLAASLAAWRAGEPGNAASGYAGRSNRIAFVFSGNGAPWPGMAQAAYAASAPFRAAVAEADIALAPWLGWSVAEQIVAGVSTEAVESTDRAQPLLFAVQHGIVAALAAQGIRPSLCLGHSVGEIAAASAAGLLPLSAAARLVVSRSRHQQTTRGAGRMAALGTSAELAIPVLASCGPGLEIAAINAPSAITVAGPVNALHRLAQAAAMRRWSWIALDLDYAFHSTAMDALQDRLLADLAGLTATDPSIPMISTVTGEPLTAADCTASYWWRNLREPVAFLPALATALTFTPGLFLEIGPNAILQGYLRESLREFGDDAGTFASLSRRDPPGDPFPGIADRAFALGADPRQGPAFTGEAARRGLPPTPFDRQRHWIARTAEATVLAKPQAEHRLLGFRTGAAAGHWTRHLDTTLEPWLADHRLGGNPVLPAAAMLDMALAAAAAWYPEAKVLELTGFAIHQALPIEAERARELRSRVEADGRFLLASRRRLSDEPWTLHAEARLATVPRLPETSLEEALPGHRLERAELLERGASHGLDYGPAFQAVTHVTVDCAAGLARASLVRPASTPPDSDFLLHPSRLDGALQGLFGLLAVTSGEPETALVPVRFARVVLRLGAAPPTLACIRVTESGERSIAADIVLRDSTGNPVAVLEGCGLRRIRLPGREDPSTATFRMDWLPALPPAGTEAPERAELSKPIAAALRHDLSLDLSEAALLLEGYCAAAAHAALSGIPGTGPYARLLLDALVEDGLAAAGPGGPRPIPVADLPSANEIWRQVLLEQPSLAQDLAWAALAAEQLPAALGHRLAGEAGTLPPSSAAGLHRLAQVLAEAAGNFVAAWPEGRPLRVLEVGAGAGPLTGLLAASLGASGRRVLMTAATLPGQASPPQPQVSGWLEVASLAWDPMGREAPPPVADLIIGLNVGAQLRIGAGLPAVLRHTVAPGGAMLLIEPLPGRLWDFCCGQDPAWCGATPLSGPTTWAAALADAGWTASQVAPLRAAPWPALLIGARAVAGATLFAAPKLRRVALFTDATSAALRPAIAGALQARGATLTAGPFTGTTLAEAARLPPQALAGCLVVVLAGGGHDTADLAATLAAIARLGAAAEGSAAGFCLVTRGQQQDPAAAACHALGRVLANEHPGLKPRRIDLSPGLPPDLAARRLAAELLTETDAEAEVTLTETGRLVARLRQGLPSPPPPPGPRRLVVRYPGQLSSLHWAPLTLPKPGPGEVLLRIEAAGLNFRDVMWAQDLLPEETLRPGFAGPNLGMECAGVVEAIGEGVELRLGQRVFGVAPAALATHAVTRALAVAPLPDGLDPVAAATMPVAGITAVMALEELARLEAGERLLIHGGAGAVGLAALQVALARGARVAASAGTAAKRAFLRAAGAEVVLDSRDAGFADALRAHWPDGVDVVLNSLAGTAMERSLGLLRPFGRFIELGKRDFADDSRVALRPLRRNATYFALDVDEVARARPALAARLLKSIATRLEDGSLRPLPATEYAASDIEIAFRSLQLGQHIGKLVIRPPALVSGVALASPIVLAARGTIVVVGGVQGFGLATAAWLAAQGARHLALISRRGPSTPGAEATIRDLAARGATATIHACDATDAEALGRVLHSIRAAAPPIRGVVHAAAVAGDGATALLETGRTSRVLAAKLTVAENLDRLTAGDPLALFLLFSSATVAIGNPGQAAYVAANAALEALARRRRAAGRPAIAIGWGPIADAGMLAGDAATAAILQRRIGATPMLAEEALDTLHTLLAADYATPGFARIAWATARNTLAVLDEPAFEAIRSAAPPPAEAAYLQARLREASEPEALRLLRETLVAELARILRLPAIAVVAEAPLAGLGLDSLGGMELRTALEQRLGMPVPLSGVAEGLSLDILARRIVAQLQNSQSGAVAAAVLAQHEPRAAGNGLETAA